MVDFRGCFEYTPRPKFNLCPKMRGFCFHLFRHFLAHFLGDLLYFIEFGTAGAFKYFCAKYISNRLKEPMHSQRCWDMILYTFIIIFCDEYDYTFVLILYFYSVYIVMIEPSVFVKSIVTLRDGCFLCINSLNLFKFFR
jgi:hypothetical protein